ncbi:Dyp-type peroxidase [Aquabacterium sp.]|uniref:Dyp-type peroxidase n=1 Tax=Aquabacterium sp. TaxID=1872578 RepID=UPI002CBEB5C2|nr:Dyp-type peroxidase [Aquabacterium sp.]HSW08401.1 Dyp-type peroxidase [Aquabacterium sp.]
MPIDLSRPLAWKQAGAEQRAMLQDLQANILKGHGRKHTAHLFLHFSEAEPARRWLHQLAAQLTSAQQQLRNSETFKRTQRPGGLVTLLFLTHAGYQALGVAPAATPSDAAFADGMAQRRKHLNDPAPKTWDSHLQGPLHAMVLLADLTAPAVRQARKALLATLPAPVQLVGEETGLGMASLLSPSEGIEHFGYVDGRSQPLMLEEDIARERDERDGTSVWDPAFGLDTALVKDPGGRTPHSFGSYFVFRKLEQNVRGFKQAESRLAKALGLTGEDAARAGAMMVGRFPDGTPVVLQKAAGANSPVPNNFDYLDDAGGAKCPFHSHIRKTNPRGETGALGATIEHERAHLMPRRGITYGQRSRHPNAPSQRSADLPTQGVGLLFMAYQANIANQFEFTQAAWANNPVFAKSAPRTGIDPLIGQGPAGGQRCPLHWGGTAASPRKAVDFRGFVTMKGGEYFFAPSISALKTI